MIDHRETARTMVVTSILSSSMLTPAASSVVVSIVPDGEDTLNKGVETSGKVTGACEVHNSP